MISLPAFDAFLSRASFIAIFISPLIAAFAAAAMLPLPAAIMISITAFLIIVRVYITRCQCCCCVDALPPFSLLRHY